MRAWIEFGLGGIVLLWICALFGFSVREVRIRLRGMRESTDMRWRENGDGEDKKEGDDNNRVA